MDTNFGLKVRVYFKSGLGETFDKTGRECSDFRNVTEIHYGYENSLNKNKIAFESDIHGTGCTFDVEDIKEFKTTPETEIQDEF